MISCVAENACKQQRVGTRHTPPRALDLASAITSCNVGTSFPAALAPPLLEALDPPATDGVGALVGGVTATFLAAVFGATRCTGCGIGRGAKTGSDVGRLPLCSAQAGKL
jgi:hypothetical protein